MLTNKAQGSKTLDYRNELNKILTTETAQMWQRGYITYSKNCIHVTLNF